METEPDRKATPLAVRWTVGGALLGGLGAGVGYVVLVFQQTSSTAVIGLYAAPLVAAAGGTCGALLGWALYQFVFERPWSGGGRLRWVSWLAALVMLAAAAAGVGPQAARVGAFHALQKPELAPRTLERAAQDALRGRDWFVLSAVARNPSAPPELLLELAGSDDPGFHERREGLMNLFDTDSLAVARKLLRNSSLPDEAIPLLARTTDAYVLGDLAGHDATPEPILREIHERSDSYLVHWGLSRNPDTPPELLEEIAGKTDLFGSWIVASRLAGNRATPVAILERLAAHDQYQVRYGLAGNPVIPTWLMEKLSADPDRRIRVRLTRNEALPFDLLERLLADPEEYVRRYAGHALARLGGSSDTPAEVVRRMATHADPLVRRQAARNPGLDRQLAEALAADPESNVRYYLAGNTSLDGDLLELLSRDESVSVRREAAGLLTARGQAAKGE